MRRLLNRISIGKKLAIILIVGFLIPMLTYTMVTLSRLRTQSEKERLQMMQQTLEHIRTDIDVLFGDAIALSMAHVTDVTLNQLLDAEYATLYEYLVVYQDHIAPIIAVSPVYRAIDWLRIYTDNDTIISGGNVSVCKTMTMELDEKPITMDILDIPDQNIMLRLSTTRSLTRGTLDISLIQNMNALPNFRRYGRILRVAINLSSLENALEKLQPFAKLILVDPMNRVLVSSADGSEALLEFDAASLPQGHAILKQRLNRIPNLQLIGIYDKQLLSEGFSAILRHYTRLAASLSILGVVLATLMARTITMRLHGIGQIAQRIAQGDFSQLDLAMMGTDEVGQLAAGVNQMSTQLQNYINLEYGSRIRQAKLQREKARAELDALQSQVDPHFMFNAMEAIRIKARARGETETARMITYMARMFRRLLDWHEDLIPLGEELAFIEEFLAIQRYRFEDSFEFHVDVSDALLEAFIPKMLIQPLVENACIHGFQGYTGKREAALHITQDGSRMRIVVKDHGEGMSPEVLQEVQHLLRNGDNAMHSVGLNNVQRRCRLYYGSEAFLDTAATHGGGSTFIVHIPIFWRKEDFHVSHIDC